MQLDIGSNSTGGTGYLNRILSHADNYTGPVMICIKRGDRQDEVYTTVLKQMNLLHRLTTVGFKYRIFKE